MSEANVASPSEQRERLGRLVSGDPRRITDALMRELAYAEAIKRGLVKCKKCGGAVKKGIAMQSTAIASIGDFHSTDFCTFSAGGPGRLIECYKCGECGHSYSR